MVERMLAGDVAARREFVERMSCVPILVERRLRRLGIRPQPAEVHDISQDVFAAVWERLPAYRAEGNLEAWVHGFVMRVALTSMRKHARAPRRLEEGESESLVEPQVEATSDRDEQLLQLVDLAPEQDRMVLSLRYGDGLSYPELAHRLGCSERAVRGRIDRAKAKIRELARTLPRL